MGESRYLARKMTKDKGICGMQIVFADIVAYSRRRTYWQVPTILAFTNCFKEALSATASAYTEQMSDLDAHLQRDLVVVPTGDGVAAGFPFDLPGIALDFVDRLIETVAMHNSEDECAKFDADGFCDCHSNFRLRVGVSEGQTVLYRDLNGEINIAGNPVNLAARVMNLAQTGQVLLTDIAYQTVVEHVPGKESQFRRYQGAEIKHGLHIDVHQYTNEKLPGLNVGINADLDEPPRDLSDREPKSEPGNNVARDANPEAHPAATVKSSLPMVLIASGQFTMGTHSSGQVEVRFSRAFLISTGLITQEDYQSVVGNNPSQLAAPAHPVEKVSWFDAVNFCNLLSAAEGYEAVYRVAGTVVTADTTRDGYRLPAEAEWEFCCRGEAGADRYGPIDDIAWYGGNAQGQTHPVSTREPTAQGVYDLLGNVAEWCGDWYQAQHPDDPQVDYFGPASGFERVVRGGSWRDLPTCVSTDFRQRAAPIKRDNTIGFRVVRIPSKPKS
ncbi:MAG TPA: SUMF1/EgtB/PvdO family nonheme iron enzyme [Solirubrobacteraceae bacterium]|nr:SUMF1/EgtB/PvdO family nonheme iron enzyme [Solirubrobacteraceae bacterium]